jgi:hypothetical protein
MAGRIFVSYRRGDDAGFTHALYARLEAEFTSADLFMDVEGHIKPGDDFREVINTQVGAADVLLAVIGPRWADLLGGRDGDPDDFVVIEIRAARWKRARVLSRCSLVGRSCPARRLCPSRSGVWRGAMQWE